MIEMYGMKDSMYGMKKKKKKKSMNYKKNIVDEGSYIQSSKNKRGISRNHPFR